MPSEFPNILAVAFVLFLLVNLVVGLLMSGGYGTMRGFAVGDYSMGTGTLTITLIVTMIGSRYIGTKTLSSALYGINDNFYQTLGLLVSGMLMGWFIFPRLLRFKHSYTLGHIMGELYGGGAQVLTGVFSTVFSVVFLVGQVVWLGNLSDLLGMDAWVIIVLTGVVVTLYTLLGGIRSVSGTDVVQFFFVVVGFALMASRIVYVVGDGGGIVSFLRKIGVADMGKFDVSWHHGGFWPTLTAAFYTCMYPTVFLTPPVLQRIFVARRRVNMRTMFVGLLVFYPVLRLAMTVIGFGLFYCDARGLEVEARTIPMVLELFFKDNVVCQVCIVLMIGSVVMSTIDSFLNATVVVILEDIVKPIKVRPWYAHGLNEGRWIGGVTLVLGMVVTLLSLVCYESPPIILMYGSFMLIGFVTFPLIMGVLGLRGDRVALYGSIVAFGVSCVVLLGLVLGGVGLFVRWFGYEGNFYGVDVVQAMFNVFPVGLVLSVVVFLGIYCWRHGGLVWDGGWVRGAGGLLGYDDGVRGFLHYPMLHMGRKMRAYGVQPRLFGFVVVLKHMVFVIVGVYGYDVCVLVMCVLCMLVGLMLVTKDMWAGGRDGLFVVVWYLSLFVCLVLYGMVMLFYVCNVVALLELLLSLLLLSMMVDGMSFCVLTLLGWCVAWMGVGGLDVGKIFVGDDLLVGVVLVSLFALMVIIFGYKKTFISAERGLRSRLLTRGFVDAMREDLALGSPLDLIEDLQEKGDIDYDVVFGRDDFEGILDKAAAVQRAYTRNISKTLMLEKLLMYEELPEGDMTEVDVDFLTYRMEELLPSGMRDHIEVVRADGNTNFAVRVIPDIFYQVLKLLLRDAVYERGATRLVLVLDAGRRQVCLSHDGAGFPVEVQPYIFDAYAGLEDVVGAALPFVGLILKHFGADIGLCGGDGRMFCMTFPGS